MLTRFAIAVTILELGLTAGASILVTYTEMPPGFATEGDLRELGIPFEEHLNDRRVNQNAPWYETRARLTAPAGRLYVSLRTDATPTDFEFRRSQEESIRDHPERGEVVIINEPLPGEKGYAVRHRGPQSARFELARLRGSEMLIVRVVSDKPFDRVEPAMLSKCEQRARTVQEHVMFKMRWRD